jgi:hypothetical protein
MFVGKKSCRDAQSLFERCPMFGSGFSLGFALTDITTQVTGFLGNPVIIGLIATSLALVVIPRIIRTAKSSLGHR